MIRRRALAVAAAATALTLGLSGCSGGFAGLYSVPLPGGADLGSHPFTVTADFENALDLVPQSAVKIGNVPVGRVTEIKLSDDDRTAVVTMRVNGDVHLPGNAVASILQTSLLGEKYVDLSSPVYARATGVLGNGSRIGLSSTSQGVEVEEIFGALSLLLNGGGLEQIQTITKELGTATSGKTQEYRDLLDQLNATVGQLNTSRASITRALDSVDQLAGNLRADNGQIASVLTTLPSGLAELEQQRGQFTAMLVALNKLSAVTVSTLDQSKDQIVGDLNALAPILGQLAAAGTALPAALQILLTYPFPDTVLRAIKGDYFNAFVVLNLQTRAGSDRSASDAVTSGVSGLYGTTDVDPLPSLLPPTSSATPGMSTSTITTTPSGTVSTSPSGTPSGSGTTSGSSTPSGTGTGTATGSGSASGPSSGTAMGGTSGTTSTSSAPTTSTPRRGGGQ